MTYVLVVACLLAGAAAGWAGTYAWFHKDNVRAKIAAEVGAVISKIGG